MTTQPSSVRQYEVHARTSPVFGRVMCGARNHHFIVDGPVGNGCPGEAPTPAEIFLSAVAACGTEVIQVIARDDGVPLDSVEVTVRGTVDREAQPRTDVTVFTGSISPSASPAPRSRRPPRWWPASSAAARSTAPSPSPARGWRWSTPRSRPPRRAHRFDASAGRGYPAVLVRPPPISHRRFPCLTTRPTTRPSPAPAAARSPSAASSSA